MLVTLIGSSLGGLTARILAQNYPQIVPKSLSSGESTNFTRTCFRFAQSLATENRKQEQLNRWERDRYLPIYHYGQQKLLPLHYDFIIDAHRYHLCQSDCPRPTLIVHGTGDDVIPFP